MAPSDMKNIVQTTKCSVRIHGATFMTSAWQRGGGFSDEREMSK